MGPDLGEVEGIIGACGRALLWHDLNVEGPAGEVTLFDTLVQVSLVAFPILGNDRLGLLIGQVLDALLGLEVKLDPVPLLIRIDKTEGRASETVHMTVGCRNAATAHDNDHLMERLGQRCPEIPVVTGASHVGAGIPLDRMVEVMEFEGVAQEEDGGIVPDKIPVPFLCIEFHGKTPNVAFGVGGAALSGDR